MNGLSFYVTDQLDDHSKLLNQMKKNSIADGMEFKYQFIVNQGKVLDCSNLQNRFIQKPETWSERKIQIGVWDQSKS